MRDHLSPFESEIKKFADCEQDILDQAILLWKILHHMIAKWQESHPDWIFVKHEDISHDPMDGFQTIFNQLNLELTDRIKNTIKEFSDTKNKSETSINNGMLIKRNSQANIWNWKKRLNKDEIRKIKQEVEEISNKFYTDQDW